jgi:hypothetical protein
MAVRLVTLALVACALTLPAVTHAESHVTHECATVHAPIAFGDYVVTRLSAQNTGCFHAFAALYGWINEHRTPVGYESCSHYRNPHTGAVHITCVARDKAFSAIFLPRHH